MIGFAFFVFIQIVLESFPISSSGHLLLVCSVLDWCQSGVLGLLERKEILYALHTPTVIVLALFYAPRWIPVLKRLQRNWLIIVKSISYVLFANSFTVAVYVFMQRSREVFPLWVGFLITIFLLLSSRYVSKKTVTLHARHFLLLGIVQGIAAVPGISRLAIVYVAGRFLGLSGKKAFDCAWLLQFSLILGASLFGWGMLFDVNEENIFLSIDVVVAMFSGIIVSLVALYAMNYLAKKNCLWIIAGYLIIPLLLSYKYRYIIAFS